MTLRSKSGLAALAAGMLVLQGCFGKSDAVPRQPVVKVTGTITFNGAPVPGASITYSPKDKEPIAMGKTDKDGKYSLTTYDTNDGAAAGTYAVLVTKPRPQVAASDPKAMHSTGPMKIDGAAMHAQAQSGATDSSGIPTKYSILGQSDLVADVKPGTPQVKDFDLKP